jgi:pimeloyl-ACP methyl ester carboxylesterase
MRTNPLQRQRAARIRGGVMLAAEAFDHLTTRVHEFHRAISDLPFRALRFAPVAGAGSKPVGVIHDAITDGVYGRIRGVARVVFALADAGLRRIEAQPFDALAPPPARTATNAPTMSRTRTRDAVVSAISGLVGDHMAKRRNPLAIRIGIHRDGARVAATRSALAAAFPDATPRVAVFVHGLCSSEHVWEMFRQPADPQTEPYGPRLARDLGFTPVYLRYNSGLHISLNGRSAARLLERMHARWPVPVQEIVLIGHSMGGLVARSAADVAAARASRWTGVLRQIVCLGSPHLGAPLEKAVHVGTHVMKRLSLSRPWARLLDSRSLGIKDLRWGYTQDREWKGRDPDAFWMRDRLQSAPVPGVRYRFLGTCLTRDPEHPVTRMLGDGLVRLPSSLALDVAGAEGAMHAQLDHMHLLNHPDVYAQLHRWLQDPAVS